MFFSEQWQIHLQLLKLIIPKRIEGLSSTHFKEQTQHFNRSPRWGLWLNLLRSSSLPKLRFSSEKWQKPFQLWELASFKQIELQTPDWSQLSLKRILIWHQSGCFTLIHLEAALFWRWCYLQKKSQKTLFFSFESYLLLTKKIRIHDQ